MKSSRRSSNRRSQENSRRRNAFLNGKTRRLCAEQLESRMLLAGDVLHNIIDPCDTNNDGWLTPADALHVINQLNRGSSTTASGEGEQQSNSYLNDVNNDGLVSPHDALLVINQLNNPEGEGPNGELVQYTVQALDASGTNLLSGPIQKGTDFYLQVLVKDLRTGTTTPNKADGVAAAFIDVLYNKALASVEIEEVQTITFLDGPSGGTFRLTFNGSQTAAITYDANNAQTTATNIQNALQGLTNIGSGNVEVKAVNLADPTVYTVRFQGALGDQDVNLLTANPGALTPSGQTMSIVETSKGVYSSSAFRSAFRYGAGFVDARNADDGQAADAGNNPPLTADPNRISDAGAAQLVQTIPSPTQNKELFRVRMNTINAGTLSLLGNKNDLVFPAHNTLLLNRNPVVDPALIMVVNRSGTAGAAEVVTISEPFSANTDTFTFTETASPSAQSLNVKSNDTPQPLTNISITRINGGTTPINLSVGTVTLASGAISFTPIANVNGSATFTYTLANASGVTDTATVTINVTAVNNAPVNTVPGTQTTPEDSAIFINGISIADVDVNETANAQMRVDLTVQNGKIALQTIPPGVVFLSGTANNEPTISIQGSLANLKTAIDGLLYTPNLNFNGADTFRIITSDLNNTGSGGEKSDNDTVTINVTAVNDAPTVTLPSPGSVLEEATLVIAGTSVDDVDALNGIEKVTLSVSGGNGGLLNLTSTTGITFVDGTANNSSSLAFTGTLLNLKAALASYQYIPQRGDATSQSITLTINDQGNTGTGGSLPANGSFNVDIIPLTLPFARKDTPTVNEDSSGNLIAVLTNDLVHPSNNAILQSVGTPDAHGTATLGTGDDTGKVVYSPTPDFWGTDTFTYNMFEDNPPTGAIPATGTVTVTITNVPDAPVAVGDSTNVDEDTSTDIAVLNNDSDPDNNNNAGFVSTLTPVIVNGPSHGTATVLANGKIRYSAGAGVGNQNYNGPDSFTYKIHDETNRESGTVTVNITVDPVNDAPVAVADSYTTNGNQPIEDILFSTTSATGVRANDSDVEDSQDSLEVRIISGPTHALTFSLNLDGSFTYQATQDYNGSDSFVYELKDTQNATATATVTLNVLPQNDAPIANPDSYVVENTVLLNANVDTAGHPRATVLANDSDVDNDPDQLSVSLVPGMGPSNATTFSLNTDGSFTYLAPSTFVGLDSFVYRLTDPSGDSSTATVTIDVREKNDPPIAVNDSYSINEDTLLDVSTAIGVRDGVGTDSDPDTNSPNSTLQVVLVPGSGPTHAKPGSFLLRSDGSFTYQGADNYNGSDSFKYTLLDAFGAESNTATVSITINEVNDPPTARNDGSLANPLTLIMNTNENPFVDQEINVLANDDASPDYVVPPPSPSFNNINETLTITAIGTGPDAPQHGTATISGGKVLYTPELGYEGTDQFTYTISDGRVGFATATVFLEVVNFIPTDITGKVFVDNNNNGIQEGNEKPLAGVKITLQGHDDILNIDFGADTDNNPNNDMAALVVYTDMNGNYRFDAPGSLRPGMRPGTYTITEEQPAFMRDGIDTAGNTAALMGNDKIGLVLPLLGIPGGINGNNFAERGLDAAVVSINDILASSNSQGLMFALNGSSQLWCSQLGLNWTNLLSVTVVVNSNSTATFTFYDKAGSPGQVRTLSQMGSTSYYNGSRFHFLNNSSGSTLLQLDASAADLGLNLLAAGGSQAEGEADSPGDEGYSGNVDAIMAEVGSA